MHAVPIETTETPVSPALQASVDRQPLTVAAEVLDPAAVAAAETNRWIMFLGVPFILAASFFMGAIGTGHLWLIGGALITGPGLTIMAFIYLGLSSDTNGGQAGSTHASH